MKRGLTRDLPLYADRREMLPGWLWLGVPIALIGTTLGVRALFSNDAWRWFLLSERGPGELVTAAVFGLAALLAVHVHRITRAMPGFWPRPCFLALGLLCLFVFGEELSWGQHLVGWGTPEWLGSINKQNETNFHNMAERLLDQKPRALASLLILAFGVVVPWLRGRGRLAWIDRFPVLAWAMPTRQLIPTGLIVVVPRVADRFQVWLHATLPPPFDIRTRDYQELQEFYIGLFILLWVANIWLRLRSGTHAGS